MEAKKTVLPPLPRLLSLDAFRGLTIAMMILVNNPGTWHNVYGPLLHADWDGITPTDLVYPFFLFIIGVSIAFAFGRRLAAGVSKWQLCKKVITRAVKIYVVGMALYLLMSWYHLYNLPEVSEQTGFSRILAVFWYVRYLGVLHRIALVFLFCGLIFLFFPRKMQVFLCILFLVGYHFLMMCVPTPGQDGRVMMEPGNNLAAWVDSQILPGRPYWGPWNPHPHGAEWKEPMAWDPEGILSTIPAVSSGLIGVFAGLLLLGSRSQERKVIILFFSGMLLAIAGYFWGQTFPVNKSLWTSSYTLITSGFACMGLGACLYFVDILGHKRLLHFAVILGCNAITIYCLSDILSWFFYGGSWGLNMQFINWLTAQSSCFTKEFASMCYGLLFVAVNFIPAYILYKCKIFIRL